MLRTILIKKLLLATLFLVGILNASAQFRSGLIANGGKGSLHGVKYLSSYTDTEFSRVLDYKFDLAVGYKFRISPQSKPHFYDIDFSVGVKQIQYIEYPNGDYIPPPVLSINNTYINFSLAPSWNYNIFKRLYVGGGIEPSLYYISGDDSGYKFDLPIAARTGYSLGFADIAFSYKLGLLNTMDSNYFSSGRFNNWQIQLFIPF